MEIVTGVFDSEQQALNAVRELQTKGFAEKQIGYVTPDSKSDKASVRVPVTDTEDSGMGQAMGAAVGGAMGAAGGATLGLAAATLPTWFAVHFTAQDDMHLRQGAKKEDRYNVDICRLRMRRLRTRGRFTRKPWRPLCGRTGSLCCGSYPKAPSISHPQCRCPSVCKAQPTMPRGGMDSSLTAQILPEPLASPAASTTLSGLLETPAIVRRPWRVQTL